MSGNNLEGKTVVLGRKPQISQELPCSWSRDSTMKNCQRTLWDAARLNFNRSLWTSIYFPGTSKNKNSMSGLHIKLPIMRLHRSMENSRDSVPTYVSEWRLSTWTQLNGPPEYAIVRYYISIQVAGLKNIYLIKSKYEMLSSIMWAYFGICSLNMSLILCDLIKREEN